MESISLLVRDIGSIFSSVVNESVPSDQVFDGLPTDTEAAEVPLKDPPSPGSTLSELHDWCEFQFPEERIVPSPQPGSALPTLSQTGSSLTESEGLSMLREQQGPTNSRRSELPEGPNSEIELAEQEGPRQHLPARKSPLVVAQDEVNEGRLSTPPGLAISFGAPDLRQGISPSVDHIEEAGYRKFVDYIHEHRVEGTGAPRGRGRGRGQSPRTEESSTESSTGHPDYESPGSDGCSPTLSRRPSPGSSADELDAPSTPGSASGGASPMALFPREMDGLEYDHQGPIGHHHHHHHHHHQQNHWRDATPYVEGTENLSPHQIFGDPTGGSDQRQKQTGHGSNSNRAHGNTKRKRTDDSGRSGSYADGGYGDDDEEDPPLSGGGNSNGAGNGVGVGEDGSRPAKNGKRTASFACPYLKYDPIRHKSCNSHMLSKISYVKQHIKRAHRMPIHCPICFETFDDEEERDGHLRGQTCQKREPRLFEGVSTRQLSELSKRSDQKKTEEEQWFFIYELIFPDSPLPRTPYVDPELSEDLVDFNAFLQVGGARAVRDMVIRRLPPSVAFGVVEQELFSIDAFAHAFRDIFKDWLRVRGGTTSPEHGANLLLYAAGRQAAAAKASSSSSSAAAALPPPTTGSPIALPLSGPGGTPINGSAGSMPLAEMVSPAGSGGGGPGGGGGQGTNGNGSGLPTPTYHREDVHVAP